MATISNDEESVPPALVACARGRPRSSLNGHFGLRLRSGSEILWKSAYHVSGTETPVMALGLPSRLIIMKIFAAMSGWLLEPYLRPDQAGFLGGEEHDDDRALRPAAGGGDEADGFHGRSEARAVVDGPGGGAEAVEVAAQEQVFVGIGRPPEQGDDVVVFDRAHLEPVADVELELDLFALSRPGP